MLGFCWPSTTGLSLREGREKYSLILFMAIWQRERRKKGGILSFVLVKRNSCRKVLLFHIFSSSREARRGVTLKKKAAALFQFCRAINWRSTRFDPGKNIITILSRRKQFGGSQKGGKKRMARKVGGEEVYYACICALRGRIEEEESAWRKRGRENRETMLPFIPRIERANIMGRSKRPFPNLLPSQL